MNSAYIFVCLFVCFSVCAMLSIIEEVLFEARLFYHTTWDLIPLVQPTMAA